MSLIKWRFSTLRILTRYKTKSSAQDKLKKVKDFSNSPNQLAGFSCLQADVWKWDGGIFCGSTTAVQLLHYAALSYKWNTADALYKTFKFLPSLIKFFNCFFVWAEGKLSLCDTSPRQVTATNLLVWHVKIFVAATEFCRCDLSQTENWFQTGLNLSDKISTSSKCPSLCTPFYIYIYLTMQRCSGAPLLGPYSIAPYVRKHGNPWSRENLVVT